MKPHESMRGYFAYYLYKAMEKNEDIWLITGDLGFGMLDKIRDDFPNRFLNTGAAEQAMMDIAVGLALNRKIPVVYSITSFLIYRPFETIRTYINHEMIPVKMVGSGRYKDYEHDGISHWCSDIHQVMNIFDNIACYYENEKEEMEWVVNHMLGENINKPCFVSLRR